MTKIERGTTAMGKYVLAWILGVPFSLLVIIYLFSHLFH